MSVTMTDSLTVNGNDCYQFTENTMKYKFT